MINTFVLDFSLSEWKQKKNFAGNATLQSNVVELLVQQLGLDLYLKPQRCNVQTSQYLPSVNGWKNG